VILITFQVRRVDRISKLARFEVDIGGQHAPPSIGSTSIDPRQLPGSPICSIASSETSLLVSTS
jgi:hypothetical protein